MPAWEKLTTQGIDINGQTIPAGTRIIVVAWGLHNNPHVWEEPTEFRPERFSPENVVKLDHYQVSDIMVYFSDTKPQGLCSRSFLHKNSI